MNVKVENLIVKEIDSRVLVEAITIPELLKANFGRKVRLSLSGSETNLDCVIKYFAERRERPRLNPYLPGAKEAGLDHRDWEFVPLRLMMTETDAGEMTIDPHNVNRVEFLGDKAERTCFQQE